MLRAAVTVSLLTFSVLGLSAQSPALSAQSPALSAQSPAPELHIAAASDLQPVMPAIAYAWQKKTGGKLAVSFGSSSALAEQILNGAPMDVFMGADFTFPEKIVAANLADTRLPLDYAKGTLVLWARKQTPGQPITLDKLTSPAITRIAVADEFHAPYGRAAFAAMRWTKTEDKLKPKLVEAQTVAQAAQFVESGNAQVGFVSLTFAESERGKAEGNYVRVPAVYPALVQTMVVMKSSPHLETARAFAEWIRSPEVQTHLKQFGLEPTR